MCCGVDNGLLQLFVICALCRRDAISRQYLPRSVRCLCTLPSKQGVGPLASKILIMRVQYRVLRRWIRLYATVLNLCQSYPRGKQPLDNNCRAYIYLVNLVIMQGQPSVNIPGAAAKRRLLLPDIFRSSRVRARISINTRYAFFKDNQTIIIRNN